jgi:hypothetical protein
MEENQRQKIEQQIEVEMQVEALKQKIEIFIREQFGDISKLPDEDVSKAFYQTFQALTHVMKRDFMQELTPPKVVKLDFK